MRPAAIAAVLAVAGCNSIFGLDPVAGRDGGSDDDAVTPIDAPGPSGLIRVASFEYVLGSVPQRLSTLGASFGPPAATCTELDRVGQCVVVRCVPDLVASRPDTGALTIAEPAGSHTILPDLSGTYSDTSFPDEVFFSGGAPIRLTSPGDEVPGIFADVATPTSVTFSSVVAAAGAAAVPVERTADLDLAWTGGTIGALSIAITSGMTGTSTVACEAPVAQGTLTLAHRLLEALPPGAGTFQAMVVVSEVIDAAPYAVLVRPAVVAKTTSGNWAAGAITLL